MQAFSIIFFFHLFAPLVLLLLKPLSLRNLLWFKAPSKGVFTTPTHEPIYNARAGTFYIPLLLLLLLLFFCSRLFLSFLCILPTVSLKWLLNSLWFHLKGRAANTWLIILREYQIILKPSLTLGINLLYDGSNMVLSWKVTLFSDESFSRNIIWGFATDCKH